MVDQAFSHLIPAAGRRGQEAVVVYALMHSIMNSQLFGAPLSRFYFSVLHYPSPDRVCVPRHGSRFLRLTQTLHNAMREPRSSKARSRQRKQLTGESGIFDGAELRRK